MTLREIIESTCVGARLTRVQKAAVRKLVEEVDRLAPGLLDLGVDVRGGA